MHLSQVEGTFEYQDGFGIEIRIDMNIKNGVACFRVFWDAISRVGNRLSTLRIIFLEE